MESERNDPAAGEGTEVFPSAASADPDVAGLIDEHLRLGRPEGLPVSRGALGRDELDRAGESVKVYTGKGHSTTRELFLNKRADIWHTIHDTVYLYDARGSAIDSLRY